MAFWIDPTSAGPLGIAFEKMYHPRSGDEISSIKVFKWLYETEHADRRPGNVFITPSTSLIPPKMFPDVKSPNELEISLITDDASLMQVDKS